MDAVKKENSGILTIKNASFINISKKIINIRKQGLWILPVMFAAVKEMIFLILKKINLRLFMEGLKSKGL